MSTATVKKRVWEILQVATPGDRLSRYFDIFIIVLIFLNVIAVIFGTVQSVARAFGPLLYAFEVFSVAVFSVEYILRVWSCTVDPRFSHPITGRLRFMVQPMSLIDLAAVLPFYLPLVGVDLRFVRILRLLRIVRVAKVGRYYSSLRLIREAIGSKKEELVLTSAVMLMLLVLSACLMYYCENSAQPESFPNIPAAMWWSVATLTTVGYGDIAPVTVIGRVLGSIIAVLGIGMFALPAGILGSAFVEEIQKRHRRRRKCPHCGRSIE